jgi:hypothetical protein
MPLRVGSRYKKTSTSSLRSISRELLIYTAKKAKVQLFEVEQIMRETLELTVFLTSLGQTVRLPHGLMGIVLIPEDDEFSDIGVGSKLFPDQRLITSSFNKEMSQWGYENIPSGRANRLVHKRLQEPKCATKIKKANEAGLLRYHHTENHRELG